jgi:FtsH-binding integral membrane protein
MSYGYEYAVAAQAAASDRATFIRRTYAHLAGAILAFMGVETLLVKLVPPEVIGTMMRGWMLVLLAYMVAGWLADSWARSETSVAMQYFGLGLYVVAMAVVFLPLIYIAANFFDPAIIPQAAILTLAVFGGLTLAVFLTRKDYSFLRPVLCVGMLLAWGLLLAGWLFGFSMGLWFSFGMVALLSGYILYYTSQVMLHYRTDQHVSAALALFASVATLFWYILQIMMAANSRR